MKIKAKEGFAAMRIKKGFSINGLAKAMGVNASVAHCMEKGRSVHPSTAKKACTALGETFETLFVIEERGGSL